MWALKNKPAAIAVLVGEIVLGVAAVLFGLAAVLGSLHDTADLSLLGVVWAAGAVVAAALAYRQTWPWHLGVLALIAFSAALSAADLGAAHNWFE